jgi:hypothetical protein
MLAVAYSQYNWVKFNLLVVIWKYTFRINDTKLSSFGGVSRPLSFPYLS